ncbi:MAG: hypothetical protein ACRDHK_13905, partial [Actinomycetota bacterium]
MELRTVQGNPHGVALLGVCQGLDGEADEVAAAIHELSPSILALALAPEAVDEVAGLEPQDDLGME